MAARNVRPADLTGKIKAEQEAAHAEDLKAREKEIGLLNASAAAEKAGVVDLTAEPAPAAEPEVTEVALAPQVKEFRVNTDLEHVTIGYGNTYHFEVGQTYKAPLHVYLHLEEKGYIWH